jgi:16S rRNA (adenine1518-N6/adenine1519-N6)-dimethyltransferase
VVHIKARPKPAFPAEPAQLSRVVAAAFNQRRKMLRASLKGLAKDAEARITAAGIDPTARAETLTIEEFCTLSRAFAAR